MRRPRAHVKRYLARKARTGSAPKKPPIVGTGRRWQKPYRKSGELEKRRAGAWAKVELTQ